jgi:hypothetical protein
MNLSLYKKQLFLEIYNQGPEGVPPAKRGFTTLRKYKYKKPNFSGVISEKLGFSYFRKAPYNGINRLLLPGPGGSGAPGKDGINYWNYFFTDRSQNDIIGCVRRGISHIFLK